MAVSRRTALLAAGAAVVAGTGARPARWGRLRAQLAGRLHLDTHGDTTGYGVWSVYYDTAGLRFYDLRRYGRDHRKILVVDDDTGFVGGYNIGSAYETEWRDTHVRITGPGVWDLKRAFADFWNLNRRPRHGGRPLLLETAADWEPRIRVHRNVPRLWMFPIRAMYLEAINRASRRIWMTHAYFIPDSDMVEALEGEGNGHGSQPGASINGSQTMNSTPFPASPVLNALTSPPCCCTNWYTRLRPIPRPPWTALGCCSSWANSLKM